MEKETVRSKLISQCRIILSQLECGKLAAEDVEFEFFGEEYQIDLETLDEPALF